MSPLHIKKFDLNLLVVLDAVVAEGNLTRAGERLGLSQSAVSHALNRLRRLTGDGLFERGQRGIEPTQLAREMAGDVRRALDRLGAALTTPSAFDPETSERMFLLDLPGGTDGIIVPPLVERLRACPGLNVRVLNGRARTVLNELRYHETWVALDHEPLADADFQNELLFEDRLVLIARNDHPKLRRTIGRAQYEKLDHLALAWSRDQGMLPTSQRLEPLGIKRNLKLTVPSLSTLVELVESSDAVATLIGRFAGALARKHRVAVHPLAFALPPIHVYMVWHESFTSDPGHTWLRGVLREICDELAV